MAELGVADEAGLNAVPRRTNLNRIMALPGIAYPDPTLLHGVVSRSVIPGTGRLNRGNESATSVDVGSGPIRKAVLDNAWDRRLVQRAVPG